MHSAREPLLSKRAVAATHSTARQTGGIPSCICLWVSRGIVLTVIGTRAGATAAFHAHTPHAHGFTGAARRSLAHCVAAAADRKPRPLPLNDAVLTDPSGMCQLLACLLPHPCTISSFRSGLLLLPTAQLVKLEVYRHASACGCLEALSSQPSGQEQARQLLRTHALQPCKLPRIPAHAGVPPCVLQAPYICKPQSSLTSASTVVRRTHHAHRTAQPKLHFH